jgi:hypothetical protein
VVGVRRFARRDSANLDIERVTFFEISGARFPSQRFRNLFARAYEFPPGRGPAILSQMICINF